MGACPHGAPYARYNLGQQNTTGMYLIHFKATFGISRYIDNTLLALHKFQAKKQVFPNRIENDRNGNSSNCIRRPGPFAMQLALRLCFCLMPIASISTSSQKIRNAVVVSHVKIHPNRRSGDTTTPHRRMEPERRLFPPPPSVQDANRGRGGQS